MSKSKSIILICLVAFSISAADYSSLKISWEDKKNVSTASFQGNFNKQIISGYKNDIHTPADTTAAAALINGCKFSWQPTWRFQGAGTVWLNAHQSNDCSLLTLVENSQNSRRERSSILVLMNLFNARVVNFALLNGIDIINFCPIPDNNKIIALVKSPPTEYSNKNSYKLILFSQYDGKKIAAGEVFQYELNTMQVSNNGAFLLAAPENQSGVILYRTDNLNKILQRIKTPGTVTVAAVQGEGFLLGGRNFIVKLDKEGSSWKISRCYKVPRRFKPDKMVSCGSRNFAVIATGGPGFYYNSGDFVKLSDSCGAALAWDPKKRQIILTRQRNSGIIVVDAQAPVLDKQLILPNKIKPRTRGRVTGLFPDPGGKAFFALDDKGTMMKFFKAGRRWKKNIIFTAQDI
ncbi:hypothetical protein P0136_13250 [Lentisphaerota bacterium ZTH]|nr:hypothetical protein JYG24_09235 [Lentisphaerota bacterium]WET06325.1 hypothetical protein P0136_13250 [Lentisphaerota bacterium ZTH]